MNTLCSACNERPVEHPHTGKCHRCYQRQWRTTNPHHNQRVGRRAEQKRRWDKAAAAKAKGLSEGVDKTPGTQSDPATAATARGHGNQEASS